MTCKAYVAFVRLDLPTIYLSLNVPESGYSTACCGIVSSHGNPVEQRPQAGARPTMSLSSPRTRILGVLDVNGIVSRGAEEIKALYVLASGGAAAAPAKQDPNAPPPGMFNMQLTNLKIEVKSNTATADMFWSSVESKTLISRPSVTEYGRDHTELVKQNGRWLIKHRVVTSGGGMPEGELQSCRKMKR